MSILAGFSVIVAAILLVVYLMVYRQLQKSTLSILSAAVLLVAFGLLQLLHVLQQDSVGGLLDSRLYVTLILLTSPFFVFFASEYIDLKLTRWPLVLIQFVPLLLSLLVSSRISVPLGFMFGAINAGYCCYSLATTKPERKRFKFEFSLLLVFAGMAFVLMVLGLLAPAVDQSVFIVIYGNLIGIAFVLVMTMLLVFPEAAANLDESLRHKYAKTTLAKVDQTSALQKLDQLLGEEKLSRNENLTLTLLAEQSGMGSHQISELINSHCGFGVSQYIRQHRINDARKMLVGEPEASILSIGFAVGFSSQSSFYTAFKQLEGQSPGNYRSRMLAGKKSAR